MLKNRIPQKQAFGIKIISLFSILTIIKNMFLAVVELKEDSIKQKPENF